MWNQTERERERQRENIRDGKDTESIEKNSRFVVARGWWWGQKGLDEGGQKAQTSSYKIKIIGNIMYNTMTIINIAVWHI